MISLMPDDIARRLGSYDDCNTPREADLWVTETVEWLIQRTLDATEPETHTWPRPAVPCPLCGGRGLHTHHDGFTLPLGLERHLLGRVNAQPRSVMEAAINLAREHWAYIPALRERERQALAERRRTETAYRVSAFGEPRLIEEGGAAPRDREQLAWAEERLASLGFRRIAEGNVIAWIDDRDTRTVYADPRAQGKITFEVWRTPLPKPGSYPLPSGTFYLLDRYHIKLTDKYAKRIEDALMV